MKISGIIECDIKVFLFPLVTKPQTNTSVLCCLCYCCQVASVVSNSVRPHGRQPTRLPRPCDSPGKNTGVGCHFLLQCIKVKSESEITQSCPSLRYPMNCSLPGSSVHGIFQARVLEWVAIAFSALLPIFIVKRNYEFPLEDNKILKRIPFLHLNS